MHRLYLDREMCLILVKALAYSLLQGAIIYALAVAICQLLGRSRAVWRYRVLVSALLLIALCVPLTTWWLRYEHGLVLRDALRSVVNARIGNEAKSAPVAPDVEASRIVSRSVTATYTDAPTRFAPWVLAVYGCGVALMLISLTRSVRGGRSLAMVSAPLQDPKAITALARASEAMGFRYTPAVATSAALSVAAVVGVIRPIVLIPLSVASGMNPEHLRLVIMHELAHIRRHDQVIDLLQRIIESFLFFNPAVWMLSSQIRAERECCCDDLVMRAGGERDQYAESLLRAGEIEMNARRQKSRSVLAATGSGAEIRSRIFRILDATDRPRIRLTRLPSMTFNLALSVGLVSPVLVTTRLLPQNVVPPESERLFSELPSHDRLSPRERAFRVQGEWSLLHRAVAYGSLEEVRMLLLNGADPNIRAEKGWTPLHFAVSAGRPDVAELLLRAGARIDGANDMGQTPLHVAAGAVGPLAQINAVGSDQTLRYLLNAGADPELADSKNNRAIFYATSSGRNAAIDELLAASVNVSAPGANDLTPLHVAAARRNETLLNALLTAGAKADVLDINGWSPLDQLGLSLHAWPSDAPTTPRPVAAVLRNSGAKLSLPAAAALGFKSFIESALDADPSLINAELRPNLYGYSMLHWAAYAGNLEVVSILLARGADVHARGDNQRTPLHAALGQKGSNLGVVTALVNQGADVNARDRAGRTPLGYAALLCDVKAAVLLLNKNATADAVDNRGLRAFDILISDQPEDLSAEVEFAKALVAHGAIINRLAPNGRSPLHAAIVAGRLEMVRYLLSAGGDPNLPDGTGHAPLMLAATAKVLPTEISQELIDRGADVDSVTNSTRTKASAPRK